ncbi:hypothetical protein ACP70R_041702 [Stipagrostis hirtigluma subsp. patula]
MEEASTVAAAEAEAEAMECGQWTAPALEELLPDLSREEQLRLQNRFRDRDGKLKRHDKKASPSPQLSMRSEQERDSFMILEVRHALRHYNARHPGGEFDAVKPLMEARVGFRGQVWFHMNFWARSRTSNKIKRFFAEVHYKPSTTTFVGLGRKPVPVPIPIVEICTIIEEPLCQYKRSCAFCPAQFDILHPKGCRKFVCGNDKDGIEQRLVRRPAGLEMPFTCPQRGFQGLHPLAPQKGV